jgi:hypothetical protein
MLAGISLLAWQIQNHCLLIREIISQTSSACKQVGGIRSLGVRKGVVL